MGTYGVYILLAAAVIVMLMMKRRGHISTEEAQRLLGEGAVVIDVRTGPEFAAGHVDGTLNIPLDRVRSEIANAVPDKASPVLLYCQTGSRSAMAVGIVRKAGYDQAYNLGSLGRARKTLQQWGNSDENRT